ncbi:hypothetical protein BTR23_02445 [Alkalihalophilus pseudofirmus]|nr:hypothetical protein BTR23_02445 [Alkalihalophilus pseudofirmus]
MGNQKGFILPTTIMLCLFMSLAVLHLVEVYMTEKNFSFEQEEIFMIESLMQMAIVDLVHEIGMMEQNYSSEFHYDNGTATYWILEESHDTFNIQLKVRTTSDRQRVVRVLLDKEQMRVKEWIELTMG